MNTQTQLSTFNFENSAIRVIAVNGEPWFVAKDICSSLNISNVTDALIKLDDDEKMILDNTLGLTESISKQVQELNLVSESGMYTLILRCREAVKKGSVPHRFRKWVTAEVLPQIRKTGSYTAKTTVDERTGLRNAVNMLVSKKGLIYSDAYNLVHHYMNVESIEDIPAEKLPMAVEYVHRICLTGELIETPKPKTVEIPEPGRWLVLVGSDGKVMMKNMKGCNFVNVEPARQLLQETHFMADQLLELAKRMRLIDGFYEENFRTPLEEFERKTLI